MDGAVPRWVRIGLIALAPGQLLTGLWAVLATRSWFDDFPGFGTRVVGAELPYNGHLASDVGAGFLATGVALLAAAIWCDRRTVYLALATFAAFTLPHLLHHATTEAARSANVVLLGSTVATAAVLAWGARPGSSSSTVSRSLTSTIQQSEGSYP